MTDEAGPFVPETRFLPWVALRSASYHPFIYQRMVSEASPDAKPGDCVAVYDRRDQLFGWGLYNPRSQIAVRMIRFGDEPVSDVFWRGLIETAAALRRGVLRLDDRTNAYRLLHAEGDDLTGLVVDRFADVLSIEVFSLGIWRLLPQLLPFLHAAAGTSHHRAHMDDRTMKQEACQVEPLESHRLPTTVTITEHGVRFRVEFASGHKTGFFCDQRENRRRLADMVADADVLDLCAYTGGFGLYAKVVGGARTVTCVDLDEHAVQLARRNANLNQARVDTVQADAFTYMRQMHANQRRYQTVILDPPKLVFGRNDATEGRRKYADLNRLAVGLVAPGGLFLTCSCSGALPREEFQKVVLGAVRQAGRECQILDTSGAGPDHPVSARCPETAYLKALWLRVL
jgi:23S rRNA (cytosine1962-C5)-methyltransferase